MKPILCFDIESTGVDVATARIVSLCMCKIDGDDRTYWESLFNPGVPIPKQASDVHGITDKMVKDAPRFADKTAEVHAFLDGCDLLGFNLINYDIPLLWEEFNRAKIVWDISKVLVFDASNIFRKKEERTLTAAVKFYCQRDHADAHSSRADVDATVDVFFQQRKQYPDISAMSREELDAFCRFDNRVDLAGKFVRDEAGDVLYAIGKVKGTKVKSDPGFARWMLNQGFSEQTKAVARAILAECKGA